MDQLDETDQNIIRFLKEDSRTAYTKIAEKLNIPDTTVHFRIKKLKTEKKIIKKFTILLSPESLGFNVSALIKIKVGDHIIKEISIKRTVEIGKSFAEKANFCFLATAEDGTILYGIVFMKNEDALEEFIASIRHDPDIIDVELIKLTEVIKGSELFDFNFY
ncbi:MAG: Lrp/AsnC family transcriptional regulator [Candidatus Helarchaeota archaeon]